MKKFIFITFLLSLNFLFAQQNYNLSFTTISCVLHIHSNFSSGKSSIEEIVDLAKKHNIDCIVLTDHFLRKAEYGILPFREIIKKSVSLPSVMKFGVDKYLAKIEEINKKQKDVIVIPGLEITPHYFWSVEEDCLVINNLHKHMLIIGLDKKNLFYSLPAIGNEANAGKIKILSFLPIVFLLLGIFLKSKFLVIFSIIFLAINYPFKYLPFDQYKNYSEHPYQNLINYINSLNSTTSTNFLILWAHPDAPNWEQKKLLKENKFFKIFSKTVKYGISLLNTKNYDGFAIFAEGYKITGKVGSLWDKILIEYCYGNRERPVWCFSEIDYGEGSDELYERKNVLFVDKKNYDSILEAYKKGRFYALWRDVDKELELYNFYLTNKTQKIKFGEEINFDGEIKISGTIKFSDNSRQKINIYVIRDGSIIKFIEAMTPYNLSVTDIPEFNNKTKVYYRIFIESKYPNMISTNPFFVKK